MTAVDVFGAWHDRLDAASLATYRAPLPVAPDHRAPGPGEQYRFVVDLDSCTGCKACVSACHSLNGLDEAETWRSVGLLVGGGPTASGPAVPQDAAPWQQHVTTACHHCLEPACLAGCPVDAYEKDPITGIVAHLDDQCIGCRYCMLTCPYEVPAFNDRLGIVRKCDMCAGRLSEGEAPACVQGCPTDAISIGVVTTVELAAEVATDADERLVPTAPRSAHTIPTTLYLTSRPVPSNAVAADDHLVVPAHNHPPLVAMLVLTQLSVGAFVLSHLVGSPGGALASVAAWSSALIALGASVLHLGRPLVAWRAVLGLRHSWLSREIVAFGIYAPLGGATAASTAGWLPGAWTSPLAAATAVVGLVGVWCSAQLYAVTGRPFWRLDRTGLRFVATMATTGAAALATATWASAAIAATPDAVAARTANRLFVVLAASIVVMALATAVFVACHRDPADALGRSAWLLRGPLRNRLFAAGGLAALALGVAAQVVVSDIDPSVAAGGWAVVLVLLLTASWIERGLFFTAAAPDRMPGSLR